MRKIIKALVLLGLIGAVVAWLVTAPATVDAARFDGLSGDAEKGGLVFAASGCNSCHAAPDAKGDDKMILTGGLHFASDFGTFIAPNISPSEAGIGDWTVVDLANAMTKGTSPAGKHYYPAFPYTSYKHMTDQDISDLYAFIQTLPKSDVATQPHDVGFPFNIRRSLGGWKILFNPTAYALKVPDDALLQRGRYLVEGPGHCAECHTPRNALGGFKRDAWLAGGPNPDGPGIIPSIRPNDLGWSQAEIFEYLKTGFTPEFDVVGGSMVSVQENMALLPDEELAAIASYLLALEPK